MEKRRAVIRISLVPFDLGASGREVCRESLEDLDYSLDELSAIEARTLRPQVERYSHQSHDWILYVDEDGFGVACLRFVRSAELGDAGAVAAHLLARRECHRDHRRGTAELCKEIERMRRQVLSRVQPTARQGLWEGVPYVFSFFLLERAPGPLTDDERRCLRALSEPSVVDEARLDTGDVGLIADEIALLPITGADEALADIDLSPRVTAHATWAGLAVMHEPGQATKTEEIYMSLEACVQLAWSAAFFARRWCERSTQPGVVKVGEVEELRRSVLSAVRRARRISDAAIPTRFRAILTEMVATSGLDEEAEHAEGALAEVERSLAAAERRERRRYTRIIEGLLALVAVTQIIPLIHEGPIVNASTAAAVAVLAALIATLLLMVRLRGKE